MKRWAIACVLFLSAPVAAQPSAKKLDALRPLQLTALSAKQARLVCEAANELQDLCAAAGRWQVDQETCDSVVASCRAQDEAPQLDCSLAQFDFGPECGATVDQYLTCIEDWENVLTCSETAANWWEPDVRPACIPLLEACPYFIDDFGDPFAYVPPCDAASSPVRVDENDDIYGLDACRPVPARMVALGDSIAACTAAFDPDGSEACAPDLIADYVRASYAPDLIYESYAVPGHRTVHVHDQMQRFAPGPGHVFVWVYVGGNDVGACRLATEEETLDCLERETQEIIAEWEPIFAYFSDLSLFPDGATFLLNTQYALADECEAPGGYGIPITPAMSAKLREYNQRVFIDPALARTDTIAIDQYPDFLGRGANANNANCPHCYQGDNSSWLSDGTHPSATGQRHIADKWRIAIDQSYSACAP